MALVEIEYGSLANSETVNNNFKYLDDKLTETSQRFTASLESQILTLNTNMNSQLKDLKSTFETRIGDPQISLSGNLPENCIWLEGAKVSRTTYEKLFEVYGTSYGEGDGETTFQLPNVIGRTLWGANNTGYIEAGLPNITGWLGFYSGLNPNQASGALRSSSHGGNAGSGAPTSGDMSFNASWSNSIYGRSNTVQPPAIKVRVYTRYQ